MEDRKERNAPWLSVPQFGDWDQKGQFPDYSLDFSKIREMRKKQNRMDLSKTSLGNEEELMAQTTNNEKSSHTDHHHHSPTARRSFFSYFNCCVKA